MRVGVKTLRRFLRLRQPEQALFLRALLLAVPVRLAMVVLPLRMIRKLASNWGETQGSAPWSRPSPERIAWAVTAASRYVPGATCLTRAIVAQALLVRFGYDSRIEFGVQKVDLRSIRAHAWVTCGERIVVGGEELGHFAFLAP